MAETIAITLPDGKVLEQPKGVNLGELARTIAISLGKKALGAVVEGKTLDLQRNLTAHVNPAAVTPATGR